MNSPTPDEIARAVRLGAAIEKVRDQAGDVVELKIVWPGWPGGKLPPHLAALLPE